MELTFDAGVIRRLGDEIGAAHQASAFLAGFTALLDLRLFRLEAVFAGHNAEARLLAVMSLRTAALQAGAAEIGRLARATLHTNEDEPLELRIILDQLRVEADAFRVEALAYLATRDDALAVTADTARPLPRSLSSLP